MRMRRKAVLVLLAVLVAAAVREVVQVAAL
jgi:hypothetical protein